MEQEKKGIVSRALNKVKSIPGAVKGTYKDHMGKIKSERANKKSSKVLAAKLMDKMGYPTTIPGLKYDDRTREIAKMIEDGEIRKAKDFIIKKRKEYIKDHPEAAGAINERMRGYNHLN